MAIQDDPNALRVGSTIAGYEILRVIGSGGFGITYEAASQVTGRHVAIKEFFPRGIASRDQSTRIVFATRDAELAAWALKRFESSTTDQCKLKHPNIVDVIHYVKDNDTGYMIMEYIEGETLEQWLRKRAAPPSAAELRPLIEPVFDALEYLHARRLIHRDIAPDNIMVRPDGTPVIIDFGAIKLIERETRARSGTDRSYSVSKQFYSPPEQVQESSSRLDVRADVYALAATIYRAVAGRPPVSAEERTQKIAFGSGDPQPPLASLAPALPTGFAAAIDQGLAFNLRDRMASIESLRQGLGWGNDKSSAATVAVPGVSRAAATQASAPATPISPRRSGWRWVGPAAVAGVLAAAILLVGGSALNLFGTRGPAVIVQAPPPVLVREPKVAPAPAQELPKPPAIPANPEPPAVTTQTKADPQADARKDFEFAQKIDSAEAYEQFLTRHPDGFHAQLARAQLQRLAAAQTRDLTVKLNTELRRVGCGTIASDDVWGEDSKTALVAFNKYASTNFGADMPSSEALETLRAKTARVCPLRCAAGQRADGEKCVAICAPGTVLAPNGTCVRPAAPPVVRREVPKRRELKCRWGDFNKGEQPHRQVCE